MLKWKAFRLVILLVLLSTSLGLWERVENVYDAPVPKTFRCPNHLGEPRIGSLPAAFRVRCRT